MSRSAIVTVALCILAANLLVIGFGENRAFLVMGLVNGLIPLIILWHRERRATVKTFDEFGWRWRLVIIYGTLLAFVSLQLASAVGGVLIGLLMVTPLRMFLLVQGLQELLVTAALLLWGVPLLYVSGRLVGRRAASDMSIYSGVFSVAAASVCAILVSVVFNRVLAGPAFFGQIQDALRETGSYYTYLLLSVLVGLSMVLLPSLCGYARGRRQGVGAYMNYVLNKVPLDSREVIVSIAHQEAAKKAASSSQ